MTLLSSTVPASKSESTFLLVRANYWGSLSEL